MGDRPLARIDLIVEPVDDGRVVYVAETQQAHYLDDIAASVWDACDGTRTAADVGLHLDRDVKSVDAMLARLADSGLLEPPLVRPDHPAERITRRGLLRRGAVAGAATTVAAGTIMSVNVPSALATMSHALNLILYRTPAVACNTSLVMTDLRGTVLVTVSGVPGNPALDKLTIVVTLTAYATAPGYNLKSSTSPSTAARRLGRSPLAPTEPAAR